MRRIVMFNHVSTDGYFAAPDGNLNWVVPDDAVAESAMEHAAERDTILFGRRTYEMFESYWPHQLGDPETAEDPHTPGRRSTTVRDMAVWINEANKLVFSRTRKDVPWKNSRVIPELDPHDIDAMKQQPGKDMMLFGSSSIVAQLTEHRLIDEYQFVVNPILLGDGRSLLNGLPKSMRLELLEARKFESGIVLSRYVPTS